MVWLSDVGARLGDTLKSSLAADTAPSVAAPTHIGILAFETAKTMSRLVSLYKSLDNDEVSRLRKEVMKAEGVAYLNSEDDGLLLNLACAERLEDLDKAASVVARLSRKCSDVGLHRFDLVYTDLKLGIVDLGKLDYGSKEIKKKIEKLEKMVSLTSRLYTALEALSELEVSERKLKQWKQNRIKLQSHDSTNFGLFNDKIAYQRKQVRHLRETSLWNQTFDRSVGLMAYIIRIIYARICIVFGPYISSLPRVSLRNIRSSQQKKVIRVQPEFCLIEPELVTSRSGPIPSTSEPNLVRFHSQKLNLFTGVGSKNKVFQAAGPSTLGGCGLAVRYANVVVLAERYLDSAVTIGDDARRVLYQMLPENMKLMVRSKMGKNRRAVPAEGWREAVADIMAWLCPLAKDTLKWQAERNFEKMRFESKPPVLLLQTLHFSDKDKAEAAIAEVLVGLSCIYLYENSQSNGGGGRDCWDNLNLVGGRLFRRSLASSK